jgi:uncharacterized protein
MHCNSAECRNTPTVCITAAESGKRAADHYLCMDHAADFVARCVGGSRWIVSSAQIQPPPIGARAYDVAMVIYYQGQLLHDVILREVGGQRTFLLLCGALEAVAVASALKGVAGPRPTMHDVLIHVGQSLNTRIRYILIHGRLPSRDPAVPDTYLADLALDSGGRMLSADLRPSDAITIALKTTMAIFISDQLTTERSLRILATRAVESRSRDVESVDNLEAFFVGHYHYRKAGRGVSLLGSTVLTGALLLATVWAAATRALGIQLRAGLCILFFVLLAVLGSMLTYAWRWLTARVDILRITADGVTNGTRCWQWSEITDIRIHPLNSKNTLTCVELRPVRRAWHCPRVMPFVLDDPLTGQECEALMARIQKYLRPETGRTI